MRTTIVAAGTVLIGVGAVLLATMLTVPQLVGLGVWLACAVVLHDGVWVPLVTAASRGGGWARRALRRTAR
ncbi:hypothetical protein [Sinomonas albida]|uniref:hypothetical protein n=1 Tax=Sinomonas albida TaxID=369942 RepID=UPI0010A857A2|nr:hypothetical protein [Sinomonas albida]